MSAAQRVCSYLGRWDEAAVTGKKALDVAQRFSDKSMISIAAAHLSLGYSWAGDLSQAVEYGKLSLQNAQTPGDKARSKRSLGWALCRAGKTDRGIELLTDATLPIFRTKDFIAFETPLRCYLGEGYWLAGEERKARQMLEEGLKMAYHCGARYYVGFAHRILGEISFKTDLVKAVEHFQKSIAVLQKIKAENELALAYVGYGRSYKQNGQISQAKEYLTKALRIFKRIKTLIEQEKVRKILAKLPDS